MTIHIANQERANAAGTHVHAAMKFLSALCAAAVFALILFPVPLFPLAPAFSLPEKAQASGVWPLPSPRLSVELGFLESYEFSGTTYTHRGVDIGADAEARVCSPVDGTVSFVGEVPAGDGGADDGGGATMRAVSVKMDDGRVVTFMPVQDTRVKEGANVSAGQELALLAAGGDRSSASTHLHMGLKRDGSYYDPLSLFGLEGTASAAARADDAASEAGATAAGGAEAGAGVQAAATSGAALAAEGVADAAASDALAENASTQESGATAGSVQEGLSAQDSAADSFGVISSGDAASALLQTGATDTSPLEAVNSFFSPAIETCGSQLEGLRRAFAESVPAPWLVAVACAGGAAGLAAIARAKAGARRRAEEATEGQSVFRRHLGHLTAGTQGLLQRLRKTPSCERESGVVG